MLASLEPIDIPMAVVRSTPYFFMGYGGIEITRMYSTCIEIVKTGTRSSVSFTPQSITPTSGQLDEFFGIEDLIKNLIINAEEINTMLRNLILQFLCQGEAERTLVKEMDFMKIKDYFIKQLKKDAYLKKIEIINTPEKFKSFRKNLQTFITERNIYTHGQLHFFRPSGQYIIQYLLTPGQTPAYVKVTRDNLQSYNIFYTIIHTVIQDATKVFHLRKI